MAKQFRNLRAKMTPEARTRASEKAERLFREMSSLEPDAGQDTDGSLNVNEHEEVDTCEASPETVK